MPPTGTVTFLFSDIEGSTRLLHAIGPLRYEDMLGQHCQLLRAAFAQHAGFEVDTAGDSFFIAFTGARDAAKAAIEAQLALASQAWPDDERIRVRIGIHTCEATPTGSGYIGIGVHLTARICAAGCGEQILLSQSTRDLLEDDSGVACLDLGPHQLKDFPRAQRIYQVVDSRLPREFPPLRAVGPRLGNLPTPPTALLGRESELAAICALARRADVRVVTLTGPAGTGKTRLALQAATELGREFSSGAFVVMLQAIHDPALLLPAIAQTLGVRQAAGQSLAAYLAPKEILFLCDNFEQIIGGASLLAELLAEAPRVKVIATSREALRIGGERVFPLSPLALPNPRRDRAVADLAVCPSVRLFVERAQSVQPEFQLDDGNAATIAALCVRLDGLPLAIELAAARVPLLSPDAILARLDQRLKLLTGGARDSAPRQQTLRSTIAWGHDLLEPAERKLFARLAVFAGGFSLEAAESVCDADLETLAALVNRSMVRREGARFSMLETIREFALEQLQAGGENEQIAQQHADYFEALAERAYLRRWHHEKEGLDELEREHDNLRATLDWLQRRDKHRALRLAGALGWFWHLRSHFSEGRRRLAEVLSETLPDDEWRARALSGAGELAAWAGDLAAARPLSEQAAAIWRLHGNTQEVACSLIELGWGCFYAGDGAARGVMEEGFELQKTVGDPLLVNRARIGLLQVLVGLGELEIVESMAHEALAAAQQTRDLRSEHFAVHFLADCPLLRGDGAAALPLYRRALSLAVEIGDRAETAMEIHGIAMAVAGCGYPSRALRLAGAAEAEFAALAIDITGITFWYDLLNRYFAPARAALRVDAATAAWELGQQTMLEDAIAQALDAEWLVQDPG